MSHYTAIVVDSSASAATLNAPLTELSAAIDVVTARADTAHDSAGALLANTVGATQLQDGAVTAGKLAADAVSHSNLAAASVGSEEIIDGNVEDKHLTGDIKIGSLAALPVGVSDRESVTAVLGDLYDELAAARNGYTTVDAYLDTLVLAGSNYNSATSNSVIAGATSFAVDAAVGFLAGQRIGYTRIGGALEQNVIATLVGTTITLTNPVGTGGIAKGEFVYGVSPEMYAAANTLPHSGSLTMPQAMQAFGQRYSPLAFGCAGDGITDDTAALNAMLSAAVGGGVIDLGAGKSYLISNQLVWSAKPLLILGLGATIVEGADLGNKATIKVSGAGAAGSVIRDFTIQGAMTGGTFPGADTDRVGVWVETDSVTVQNLTISGKQYGVKLELGSNCVVDLIRFTGVFSGSVLATVVAQNYHSGVRTRAGGKHLITRVYANNCGSGVLLGGPCSDVTVANCIITNTWDNGIYSSGCDRAIFAGNRIATSGGSGIKVRGSYIEVDHNVISGTVTGATASGYNTDLALRDSYGADGADIIFSNNVIYNTSQDGLNIASSPSTPWMYVRHLKVVNNIFDTIATSGGAYTTVRGAAYYSDFSRNTFLSCSSTTGIISLAGANHDPRSDGALGWLSGLIVEDNLFDGLGGGIAMQLQWMQYGRVCRNTFRNLPSHAIKLLNCSYSLVRDNVALDTVGGQVLWASLANGNSNNVFAGNLGTATLDETVNTISHNSGAPNHNILTGRYKGAGADLTDLALTAGLVAVGPATIGGNAATTAQLKLNGANNTARGITIQTAGVARWIFQTQTSEPGSGNTGSDLALLSRDDAGALLDTVLTFLRGNKRIVLGSGIDFGLNTGTGTKIGVTTNDKLGFWGKAATTRPGAYTQTYSTADKTVAAQTAITQSTPYTGLASGVGGTPYASLTDINALRAEYEHLRADHLDLLQAVTALIDDMQDIGIVG